MAIRSGQGHGWISLLDSKWTSRYPFGHAPPFVYPRQIAMTLQDFSRQVRNPTAWSVLGEVVLVGFENNRFVELTGRRLNPAEVRSVTSIIIRRVAGKES